MQGFLQQGKKIVRELGAVEMQDGSRSVEEDAAQLGVEGEFEAAVFEAFDFGSGFHVEVFWGSCAAWFFGAAALPGFLEQLRCLGY